MKQITHKTVRTVLSKDGEQTIVEKKLVTQDQDLDTVKQIDRDTEYGTRPYPTLPPFANPNDPPQHADRHPVNFDSDVTKLPENKTDKIKDLDFGEGI